jgi:hypothetical protein
MNKNIYQICLMSVLALYACSNDRQAEKEHQHEHTQALQETAVDTIKKSIPKEVHAMVGGAHVTLAYHAPAVRGRTIWGGLVPYDEVWVTGAHRATSFEINKDFVVGSQTISAGKYAIFTIPGKEMWTIIINKKWNQHLADEYTEAEDVVRVTVTPEVTETMQERLKYEVNEKDGKGILVIAWEKIRISIPFDIKK